MNEETKKKINAKYQRKLQNGERFWPDSIFKDVIVALGIFIILILLATFVGIHDIPKADPSDTSYIPRPEWYFLFLFKFLALYGQVPVIGKFDFIATVIFPTIVLGALALIPFIDKSPYRHYSKRVLPISIMTIFVVSIIMLTMISDIPTTSGEEVYIAGITQVIGGLIVPGIAFVLLFGLAFFFKQKANKGMIWTTTIASILMAGFTFATLAYAPVQEKDHEEIPVTLEERILAGQDLYSLHCVECHGDDGSVAIIEGVAGLDGEKITPINHKDVLYTITDASMYEVIAFGRPSAGMPPSGLAYGGKLTRSQIDYMVTFMRYAWDDRFEMPEMKPLFPPLAEGEVPSYDVHVAPIVKRSCISCHREGKDNNDYWMTTYEEIINSGENKDKNIILGENFMDSYLILTMQGVTIHDDAGKEIIGIMPPNKLLSDDSVEVFIRWIQHGMPRTAEEASALWAAPAATPAP